MNRSFIWYNNVGRKVFPFVSVHMFDRQTDRQKGNSNTVRMHSQVAW